MDDVWATARGRNVESAILRMTAKGDDPVLAEFANEVLSGRHTLRDLAFSSAYAEELHNRMRPLLDRWEHMSPHDRQDAITHADTYNQEVLAHFETLIEPPPAEPEHPAPAGPDDDDEDFSQRTYLRRT